MGDCTGEYLTQLPVVIDSMNVDTYSRFLKVPGLLNVQLKAPGATAERMRQHPARLSMEGKISMKSSVFCPCCCKDLPAGSNVRVQTFPSS